MTPVDRLLLGGAAVALAAGGLAAWLLAADGTPPATSLISTSMPNATAHAEPTAAPATSDLVVDVEGAVQRPGIQILPAGSRVADALAAAGGYAPDADLAAAAHQINQAAPLTDGQQVYVPQIVAEAVALPRGGGSPAGGSGGGATAGPINVNTATPEQLDTLPGIGPVTVQKIVAGRQERPFTSLEEMVERKVINRGQLEKIRDLAVAS
jgi:competence protein ComEA